MVKVIKPFVDKKTRKPYNIGYEYESKDEKRIEELQKAGYLEKTKVTKVTKPATKKKRAAK